MINKTETSDEDDAPPTSLLTLVAEPPMPLIREGKFSLEPDLALGWKPDDMSMRTIPSLSQFKPLAERLEDREKEQQKLQKAKNAQAERAEREALIN